MISTLPGATTSFVGRAEELAKIAALLADPECRLLTLLGPGGIGKTRLALQAAAQQLEQFADGVYFVPLTSISAPDTIPSAIANVLQRNFYSMNEIISYLHERQVLLVLDNFEHLLDGSNLLADILQAAAEVKLLVTSRERLNLQEEWVLAVDGLGVPDTVTSAPLESYPAAQLFAQRARQVQAGFALNEHLEAVKTICQSVEGMPLGLELAASWLRVMSCEQIAAQMTDSIDFLTTPLRNVPERHRSLRAVFEQSWNLLTNAEKSVLMCLSIFRGGFDLEAAEQVAGATLLLLAGLADKSLVRLHHDGRYDLHELLRQYATEKLADAGETSAAADAHLCYYTGLAETAEARLWGREQAAWYDRLEAELDNLRSALNWSLEGGNAGMGLQLAGALGWFYTERSRPLEGQQWLIRTLAAAPDAPTTLRAKAFNRAGELAGLMEGVEQIYEYCEQALRLARSVDDRVNAAWALSSMGYYPSLKRPPTPAANAMLEESIALFREMGDAMGLNHALRRFAQMTLQTQDYAHVQTLLDEAMLGAREADDRNALAQIHLSLGDIYRKQERNFAQAAKEYEISLGLFEEQNNRLGTIYASSHLGEIEHLTQHIEQAEQLYRQALLVLRDFAPTSNTYAFVIARMASATTTLGDFERATVLFAAISDSFHDYNPSNDEPLDIRAQEDLNHVHMQMSETAFTKAWAAGRAMSREQVIAYALQPVANPAPVAQALMTDDTPSVGAPNAALVEPLTERELEILQAVAQEHSNRVIAAELFLALGTVKWYLNAINTKLGVSSRTQAVARARELNLLP